MHYCVAGDSSQAVLSADRQAQDTGAQGGHSSRSTQALCCCKHPAGCGGCAQPAAGTIPCLWHRVHLLLTLLVYKHMLLVCKLATLHGSHSSRNSDATSNLRAVEVAYSQQQAMLPVSSTACGHIS